MDHPTGKKSNDVRGHERRERVSVCRDERKSTSQGKLEDLSV